MKKAIVPAIAVLSVTAIIIVLVFYRSWIIPRNTSNEKEINVENSLTYEGELTGDELFTDISPAYLKVPKGFKRLKIRCSFTNNEKFDISGLSVEGTNNDKIATYDGCLNYSPSFPIEIGETIECDLYIFVDETMNEKDIKNEINQTTFTFFCYNNNDINNPSRKYFTGTVQ
ncbi:MAG: hypothetical protein IJ168_00600 [Eubacterium sp.]|nr:hypothetical protein [Eubacterium sp.]